MNKPCVSILLVVIISIVLSSCNTPVETSQIAGGIDTPFPTPTQNLVIGQPLVTTTPSPTRPPYPPGELVDYIAQSGDTLTNLAKHFNTSVEEILTANNFIPEDATTMPPGMPMKIPIYYQPFWGSQYQIIPDSLFINGPAQVGFDTAAFVAQHTGWLNGYTEYAFDGNRSGAEIIDYVALNYSVSPRLMLGLLEYQDGALSIATLPEESRQYPLGYHNYQYQGLYMQLVWAANLLNNAYYEWRDAELVEFEHLDGKIERFDPWQNAASVALQYYFSRLVDGDSFAIAISQDGLARSYKALFGDPWQNAIPHIPGSLTQPPMTLPFLPGLTWAYTGGPHTGFGVGEPLAAIDFAPGATTSGCVTTDKYATAVAPGIVVRSDDAAVVLDLDGDGDERTGWTVFYYHIETKDRVVVNKELNTGDPIGHPSCEGGRTTGTHVHIARKYNGEWMPADGIVPYNLGGWVAHKGVVEYQGTLAKGGRILTACTCADATSQISAEK
ncbi:MAG TPA: LysM peptidoglycan-binding domain-containing protein [Anaerolineales bacterium]|nr:LysM peptidoglycan-binding domain-containing protein [Anaerolineales bacterium]